MCIFDIYCINKRTNEQIASSTSKCKIKSIVHISVVSCISMSFQGLPTRKKTENDGHS